MKLTKWRIVSAILVLLILAGIGFGAWTVDRMALGYLTGQRRAPGKDWFGRDMRMDGPPPGLLFLGSSRPSTDPAGFVLTQPREEGARIGLQAGDIVTSVDGLSYANSFEMIRDLIDRRKAGETIQIELIRDGEPLLIEAELRPFFRSPADLGLDYKDIEFDSASGNRISGWLISAPPGNDGRAVVFVHGANSSRFQAFDGAPFWHRRGYAVLTFDLSGRGSSGGRYITYTVNERHDVKSAYEWLRGQPGIDPAKVVIFGTSNGASSAIYAAGEIPDLPALVLDAPYSNLVQAAQEMLKSRRVNPDLLPLLRWAVRLRAGVRMEDVRPGDVITSVKAPVLLIHGDADTQVPAYHSAQMQEARLAAGLPSERWLIPGGEHGFDNYPPLEEFWGRIVDFCDLHLGGAWVQTVPSAEASVP